MFIYGVIFLSVNGVLYTRATRIRIGRNCGETVNINEKAQFQAKVNVKDSTYPPTNQPLFLTRMQLGQWLNMSPASAMRVLNKYNIQPVDLGRGRGNGLRWRTSAVIEVADILHTEAQAKKTQRRIKKSPYTIRGKSAADLFAEFNGGTPLKAEVCNGD